jgi:hypothetical protein
MRIVPQKHWYGPLATKCAAKDYYVKPIAAWVLHLLFEDYIPCCPNCKSSKGVIYTKAVWVHQPLVMYGINEHHYLRWHCWLPL